MPAPPTEHDHAAHRCPECGGDARVTSELPSGKPLLTGLLVLLLLLALLVYLSPWVQMKLGDRFAVRDAVPTKSDPQFHELSMTITKSMLLDAELGSTESRNQILDQLMSQINDYNDPGDDLLYRFAYCPPIVTEIDSKAYGCAGTVWEQLRIHYDLISDRGSATPYEQYPSSLHTSLNRTRWWPYQRTRIADSGSSMLIQQFRLIGLCSTVAVAIALAWIMLRLYRKFGKSHHVRFPHYILILFLTLFALSIWSYLRPQSRPYRSMQESPIATTPWEPVGTLQARARTPHGREELFQSLIDSVPITDSPLLVATQWKRNFTPRWRNWRWGNASGLELLTIEVDNFYSAPAATVNDLEPVPHYIAHTLPKFNAFSLRRIHLRFVLGKSLWSISFSPANWVMLVVGSLLLWSMLRFIVQGFVYLTQRKRAKKDLCIFCAYPLSPEALAARWEDASPGP